MVEWKPHIEAPGIEPLEFEALLPIYEQALADTPGDLPAMAWLAHAYTVLGRHEEGLELDLRLTELLPDDPTARYNLGCSYALLGRTDDALAALTRAVESGYRDPDHMRQDEDLESLRTLPAFKRLLRRISHGT